MVQEGAPVTKSMLPVSGGWKLVKARAMPPSVSKASSEPIGRTERADVRGLERRRESSPRHLGLGARIACVPRRGIGRSDVRLEHPSTSLGVAHVLEAIRDCVRAM